MVEEWMKGCMRKLALWQTRTLKPVMSHEELDPIMSTLGFRGLPPAGGCREYVYGGGGWWWTLAHSKSNPIPLPKKAPRLILPYPRIDGLHIYTYRAFLDALNFYLDIPHISDLFHIRGMPLHRWHDRKQKFNRMEEDDSVFVYREGTLDESILDLYQNSSEASSPYSSPNNTTTNSICAVTTTYHPNVVPLKDVIVL